MQKFLSTALFLVILASGVQAAENTDVVVLLDNSVSVLPMYDDLEDRLIRGILESHLLSGDRFHLISFADEPEIEIAKEIREKKQVEEVLDYVQILQPMGQYTDLLLALMFLDTYVDDLSLMTHKNILILTDGVHDPPPDSPFYGLSDDQVKERMAEFARELRRKGWEFHILDVNGAAARQDRISYLDTLTENLGIEPARYDGQEGPALAHVALGVPRVTFPDDLGDIRRTFSLPLEIKNYSSKETLVTVQEVILNGSNILRKERDILLQKDETGMLKLELRLPGSAEPGPVVLDLTLVVPKDQPLSPLTGDVRAHLISGNGGEGRIARWLVILIAVGVGIGVIILVVSIVGRGFSSSGYEPRAAGVGTGSGSGEEDEHPARGTASAPAGAGAYGRTGSAASVSGYTSVSSRERTAESGKKAPAAGAVKDSRTIAAGASGDEGTEHDKKTSAARSAKSPRISPAQAVAHRKEFVPSSPGSRPIEMLVSGQSRVAVKNICAVTQGAACSVGGGRSSRFVIFIAPLPEEIARLEHDQKRYSLVITNPASFYGRTGVIYDCMDRDISVRADNGEEITLRFQEWISPLERINRILHLTDKPGLPDFDY